jgi:branched-chain amino acid transport system ATP-binding protein
LTFGYQRLLELARVAALLPTVVFMDEPVSGLDEEERERMRRLIGDIARATAVCLIEHDMRVVSDLATTVTVLDQGAVIASGDPTEVSNDAAVRRAYLGDESVATG